MKPSLPSFLALIAVSLGPVDALAAWQQPQTIWVDVGNQNTGDGSQGNPYHSLSFAISQTSLNPGDIIKILGRNNSDYTNDPSQPTSKQEVFPIILPDGVTLEFVPSGVNQVRRATFRPTGSGAGLTCFKIQGGNSAFPTKFQGHFDTNPMTVPDQNQGIVIQDFEVGISLESNTGTFSSVFSMDGVRLDGRRTGFLVLEPQNSDSVMGTLQRSRILGSSGTFAADQPLVDLQVTGSTANMDVTLQQDVVLPQGQNLTANAINLNAQQSGTTADLTLESVVIQGRSDIVQIPPPPTLEIDRAGLKFVYKMNATGTVTINNSTIQDANGAGIYGLATSSALISIFGNGNRIQNNGNQPPMMDPPTGPPFSRSGMMLIIHETADWNAVNFMNSRFTDNKVHGVHLIGLSDFTQDDQFQNVEFDDCQFRDNGKNAPMGPPFNGQGHGFFSDQESVELHATFRRSRFSGNGTCGLRFDFGMTQLLRNHTLGVSNCVFAGNAGKNSQDISTQRDINPLTVISENIFDRIRIQLAQLTISENPTPYSVSLWDKATDMSDPGRLWDSASDAHNCIFDGNGRDLGSGKVVDAAFFPLPPSQCPSGSNDLFCLMAASTMNCVLGDEGLTSAQMSVYDGFAASPNNDVIDPKNVLDLQPWQDLGLVFPSQPEVLDQGIDNTVPSDTVDFRGAARLYDDPNIPNAPSMAGKDIGAFEKQAND